MLEDFQGDSWGSILPLRMSSLLPHDLCHGRSTSLWPPTFMLSEVSREALVPCLILSFMLVQKSLTSLGVLAHHYNFCLHHHVGVSLCLSICLFLLFLWRPQSYRIKGLPISVGLDLSLYINYITRDYFQISSHSQLPAVRMLTYLLGGTIQLTWLAYE